jgi:succinyl-CoA synthetase alpha subunit
VKGPDCGNGDYQQRAAPFANVVRAGDIGVVAASGTGTQSKYTSLIDQLGGGVSQVIAPAGAI